MTEVILAKKAGFCPGIKRAVELALKAREENEGSVYLYGELAHNRGLIEHLSEKGLTTIDDWRNLAPSTILIRSHGLAPSEKAQLVESGWFVIDATCPWVSRIHDHAKRLQEEGFPLLVIGDSDHPEVQGFLKGDYGEVRVISDPNDVFGLPKLGVVVQSTFSPEKAGAILGQLFLKTRELRAFQTLCGVTAARIEAALQLASEVDMMVVVGGAKSSNTRQLTEACRGKVPVHQIESAEDIQEDWLKGLKRIGVAAGASTPEWLIQQTIQFIAKMTP
ncbi:MAG TPA: 4-hydroxy-3-methylbut-2-enyl diphosphate reductase [Chroococcales cyanobacterium]|jgi:4-hydroxy-3-methylbut-2-enyl diphosphate reductase